LRFGLVAFLTGAGVFVGPGSTVAVVLLSSTVGVGWGVGEGAGVVASATGSVSPLAPSQAFQPPRSARAL
jgi:hypothetical protein